MALSRADQRCGQTAATQGQGNRLQEDCPMLPQGSQVLRYSWLCKSTYYAQARHQEANNTGFAPLGQEIPKENTRNQIGRRPNQTSSRPAQICWKWAQKIRSDIAGNRFLATHFRFPEPACIIQKRLAGSQKCSNEFRSRCVFPEPHFGWVLGDY